MARSKLHVSAELLSWWNMVEPRLRCKSEDVRSNASFGCLFNQLEWFWMCIYVHLTSFNLCHRSTLHAGTISSSFQAAERRRHGIPEDWLLIAQWDNPHPEVRWQRKTNRLRSNAQAMRKPCASHAQAIRKCSPKAACCKPPHPSLPNKPGQLHEDSWSVSLYIILYHFINILYPFLWLWSHALSQEAMAVSACLARCSWTASLESRPNCRRLRLLHVNELQLEVHPTPPKCNIKSCQIKCIVNHRKSM